MAIEIVDFRIKKKWWFSTAMLVYQRVYETIQSNTTCGHSPTSFDDYCRDANTMKPVDQGWDG